MALLMPRRFSSAAAFCADSPTSSAMTGFIVIVAFGVGYLLRIGLEASSIHLILNEAAIPEEY